MMDRKSSIEAKWELIYNTHAPVLYHYGNKLTPNNQLIEDCIQDVFAELWEKRNSINNIRHIQAYLIKVFRRKVIHKLHVHRQQDTHHPYVQEIAFNISFSFESSIIQHEICEENQKRLQKALQLLTHRQRETIYLKFYEGYAYDEIAEIMNLEKSAVYSFIYKAMTQLRDEMKDNHLTVDSSIGLLSLLFLFLI